MKSINVQLKGFFVLVFFFFLDIEINRKVLADLAMNNPEAFKAIVAKVK